MSSKLDEQWRLAKRTLEGPYLKFENYQIKVWSYYSGWITIDNSTIDGYSIYEIVRRIAEECYRDGQEAMKKEHKDNVLKLFGLKNE